MGVFCVSVLQIGGAVVGGFSCVFVLHVLGVSGVLGVFLEGIGLGGISGAPCVFVLHVFRLVLGVWVRGVLVSVVLLGVL